MWRFWVKLIVVRVTFEAKQKRAGLRSRRTLKVTKKTCVESLWRTVWANRVMPSREARSLCFLVAASWEGSGWQVAAIATLKTL